MDSSLFLGFVCFTGLFVFTCCLCSLLDPSKKGQALYRLKD